MGARPGRPGVGPARTTAAALLGAAVLALAPLGYGAAAGGSSGPGRGGGESDGSPPAARGGTTVGPAIAGAKLKPVGDYSAGGNALFEGVGSTDVQVELDLSGLPKKGTNAGYYAQIHAGSCSVERHGAPEKRQDAVSGPVMAFLRFDRLLADGPVSTEAPVLRAHDGHEPGVPEEPSGSIEQPVSFGASPEGTISVVALLEGVAPERLTSGNPKYIHVHAAHHNGGPEELACGDLRPARASG